MELPEGKARWSCSRELHMPQTPRSRFMLGTTIRALDASGRPVIGAAIRYERIRGDALPLTADGVLSCPRRGDVGIRATLGHLAASFFVRCRPVEYVRLAGPVQFILGDSLLSQPRVLPVAAYDADGRAVVELVASLVVRDSSVAGVSGTTISPRTRGPTILGVHVGSRAEWTGLHIDQRVAPQPALVVGVVWYGRDGPQIPRWFGRRGRGNLGRSVDRRSRRLAAVWCRRRSCLIPCN